MTKTIANITLCQARTRSTRPVTQAEQSSQENRILYKNRPLPLPHQLLGVQGTLFVAETWA